LNIGQELFECLDTERYLHLSRDFDSEASADINASAAERDGLYVEMLVMRVDRAASRFVRGELSSESILMFQGVHRVLEQSSFETIELWIEADMS
jgi:hypothetical protein